MDKEYILCAAIWFNDNKKHKAQPVNINTGFIITGRRHSDCYQVITSINGNYDEFMDKFHSPMSEEDKKNHHGFITNLNRYLNRKEAWKVALEAKQIQYGYEASLTETPILISENLYFYPE